MTTISIVLISVLVTLVIILGFACFNLLRKYENVEDIISQYDTYITEFSKEIGSIEKRLKDIDAKGTFEGDDEIGWFFKQIKVIQNRLSKFKIQ
jgi:predicted PurR-regulated permease PerM|tara:strand:+ start:360 stop:641 length:282 start_codon:yes stop_codon:yes gene_type:complete